ncbi:pregnancy-specific glycoprotein 22-like [Peromyscus maniculatus bairdii]|uniref:Ig-like domain-containing protein n=1 Tax=Peromyscus maniculatus bairdii TaxID=230844 RepID=A0A8C8UGE7_PERMB
MEVSSVIPCKGWTSWQGLLLTASIFTCWHLSTTDHITIKSFPSQVANGDNVLLLVNDLPEDLLTFTWFKGETGMDLGIARYAPDRDLIMQGPGYSGRETVYRNGSLLIQNVNEKDTGLYTLQTLNEHGDVLSITTMRLHVYPFLWTCGRLATSAQLTAQSVPPSVAEGGSVLLLVHNPPENIIAFGWFKWMNSFRKVEIGQYIIDRKSTVWGPAYTGRETLYSDGSLLLRGVTQNDRGLYTVRILRTDMRSEEAEVQLQVNTSLSLCYNLFTSSQTMIQPVPQYPAEGEGVLLQVHNLPEDLVNFVWYKSKYGTPVIKIVEYSRDMNSVFWWPAYRGRGMVYYNGSLMLQNVTEKDAGMYTLEVLKKNSKIEKASVEFNVKKDVTQPFVRVADTTVEGRRSVTFSCISPDTDISIRWIFNNRSLHHLERVTLSPTKCGLRIDSVGREDAGEYKCEVTNGVSLKTSLPVWWP